MEQSGANAGPDQVFNWQPVHQQVNQLIQRDIYHQRQMQDVANKAAIELKKAGTAARPEDIPELSNLYNTYRTAGMQLLNPKVNRDPTQRAYWQKVQDESELNYHSLANDSKETGKTLAALPLEYAKSGGNGFKPLDEFGQQLQQAKGLSTRQIRERGLDNPITYMGAKELYPAKDYQQHVYGGYESVVGADPVKDAKGQTTAWQEKHTKQPKNPVPVIVHNTVEAMNGIPSIHKQANDAFMTDLQTSPEAVDATIKNAQEFVKSRPQEEQDHIMPYLAKNPLGYELAKNLLGAKPEVTQGKMTEDPLYKDQQTKSDAWARLRYSKDIAQQMQNRGFAHAEKMKAITIKNAQGQNEDLDTRPMFEAAQNPDKVYKTADGKEITGRDMVNNYAQAIAANNPKNITAITISKQDLYNDKNRRALYNKLGIDEMPAHIAGKYDQTQLRAIIAADFTKKVNEKYKGQIHIKPEDLEKFAIPAFIRRSYTKDMKGDLQPQETISTANPATSDYGQFHSVVSQQSASKKKAMYAKQSDDLENMIEVGDGEEIPMPKFQKVAPAAPAKNSKNPEPVSFTYDEKTSHGIKNKVTKVGDKWYWEDDGAKNKRRLASDYFQGEIQKMYEQSSPSRTQKATNKVKSFFLK